MAKDWTRLSVDEKLNELRADIIKTMAAVNGLSRYRDASTTEHGNIQTELKKLQDRLTALEAKTVPKKAKAEKGP